MVSIVTLYKIDNTFLSNCVISEAEEDARNSHLLFTLHVYQYRVEKNSKGQVTGKEQQGKYYIMYIVYSKVCVRGMSLIEAPLLLLKQSMMYGRKMATSQLVWSDMKSSILYQHTYHTIRGPPNLSA